MSVTDANGIAFPAEDGGPAFPAAREESVFVEELDRYVNRPVSGMSLRDYFAGQALAGFISGSLEARDNESKAAEWAYSQADAMLKERAK